MNIDNPAYRAATDRGAAAAIDAVTSQARRLDHLDPAVAIHRMSLALQVSQMPRAQFAAVLAALAVHTVRAEPRTVALPPTPATTGAPNPWRAIWTRLTIRRGPRSA